MSDHVNGGNGVLVLGDELISVRPACDRDLGTLRKYVAARMPDPVAELGDTLKGITDPILRREIIREALEMKRATPREIDAETVIDTLATVEGVAYAVALFDTEKRPASYFAARIPIESVYTILDELFVACSLAIIDPKRHGTNG